MLKKRLVIAAVIVLGIAMVWLFNQPSDLSLDEKVESQEQPWEDPVVKVVQSIGPATVKIETIREVVVDQFFFKFLEEQPGIGSGVIFRPEGFILTNDHVIQDATEIVVRLEDGRSFEGEIVGRDPLSDLAVLKIEGPDLSVAPIGDSNELRVGQRVIAIGNPLGIDNTVTVGVVSAVNRDLLIDPENDRFLEGMIQTDAAINPGNSGGPLLNENGEIIGVNTAIFEQAQGIGFAIPSISAKLIADQLIQHGKPLRLGILGGSLVPALAETIRNETNQPVPVNRGAYITRVIRDSPADEADLQPNDIIVAVQGQEIAGMRELRDEVQKIGFGNELKLAFYRGEERKEVIVTL